MLRREGCPASAAADAAPPLQPLPQHPYKQGPLFFTPSQAAGAGAGLGEIEQ